MRARVDGQKRSASKQGGECRLGFRAGSLTRQGPGMEDKVVKGCWRERERRGRQYSAATGPREQVANSIAAGWADGEG